MVSLKQIQNFLVLAKVLHFAKAAAQLNISQATLSCEIKKLEKSLGIELFDRSNKWDVKLTTAGEAYYNGVQNIPGAISEARQEAIKRARGTSGSLTAAVSSAAYDFIDLGATCKKIRNSYPEIQLKILDLPSAKNRLDILFHGNADAAIFIGDKERELPDGFALMPLIPLTTAIALPRQSRWAKMKKLDIADLKNAHFILPPREVTSSLRQHWDEIFMARCGSLPVVTHEVMSFHGILQFVSAGLGVGFIFRGENEIVHEDVILRELPVSLNRYLLAAYREQNSAPVVKNFLQQLLNDIQQI